MLNSYQFILCHFKLCHFNFCYFNNLCHCNVKSKFIQFGWYNSKMSNMLLIKKFECGKMVNLEGV